MNPTTKHTKTARASLKLAARVAVEVLHDKTAYSKEAKDSTEEKLRAAFAPLVAESGFGPGLKVIGAHDFMCERPDAYYIECYAEIEGDTYPRRKEAGIWLNGTRQIGGPPVQIDLPDERPRIWRSLGRIFASMGVHVQYLSAAEKRAFARAYMEDARRFGPD